MGTLAVQGAIVAKIVVGGNPKLCEANGAGSGFLSGLPGE